ncbi:MAG: T9SS type A sorting domain-containing protein [Ignavibacteria bacterium]|nr:T9SS type A sorting domain-containing protein [Ignavibacteria bacterium]
MNTASSRIFTALLFLSTATAFSQVSITTLGVPYTQNFDSFDTATTAAMPAGWKLSKDASNVRTVGAYSAAVTATERRAGNSMSSTAANGIYNYGAGDAAVVTERCPGFIASGSGTKSGNVYAWYRNNGANGIASFTITYNVEKYRGGSNSAGWGMQLYYSFDGTNWITAGASFFTGFTADANNNGYASAPGATSSAAGALAVSVPANTDIYFAWNYSVTSGTTTTNAQGLGVDDVSITPQPSTGLSPTVVQFATATSSVSEGAGSASITVNIANPSPTAATTVQVALTGGTAVNGTDIVPAYVTQTLTFPANDGASRTATFTPFDDAVFTGSRTAIFQLQNVTGGTTALIGGQSTHTATILENDSPPAPTVVVNEYYNGNGDISSFEAVELLVVKDSLDMRGFSIADATSGGTYPFGSVKFTSDPLWSNVQAGTIIVVGGLFALPAEDLDPSDGLLMVYCPDGGDTTQYLIASGSVPSIAAASDAVAIRDAGNSFIHGLAHGTANQNTLPAGRSGWLSGSIASGQTVSFTRTAGAMTLADFLTPTFIAALPYSFGAANDTTGNRDFLRGIRSRNVVHARNLAGTFFWNITVSGATVNMTGPVNIGNALTVNEGTFNENGLGMNLDGGGNAQNGIGAGTLTVGDNAGSSAVLNLTSTPSIVSGAFSAGQSDATVDYRGTATQTVLPGTYFNLKITNGNASAQKLLANNATVNGALTINAGAYLNVDKTKLVTLGPTGSYTNAGRFLGSIQTTRSISAAAVPESFGGIGLAMTANGPAFPGSTTVKMTSGYYLWVANLPSILKYYTVTAANGTGNNVTLTYKYEALDLNGQIEASLGLKNSTNGGGIWTNKTGTLSTGAKTITHAATDVNGIWTAHANPPQGTIASSAAALSFTAEQNYLLPASQPVTVSNVNGSGSIIEWTATPSTTVLPTWLAVTPSPASGVNSGAFTVDVLRTDLAPGVYTGSITVADPHATNSPFIIPVTYTVLAPRKLCVGADTIFIKATWKMDKAKKTVAVLNCGGAFGPDVILWTVSTAIPWLGIEPVSGSEGQAFVLTANTMHLDPGSYVGSVTITGILSVRGTPVSNSPLTIPVILEVEPDGIVTAPVGPMSPGDTRLILNPRGQRIAKLKLNSGSLTGVTVHLMPDELPSGISRLRYALRWYTFAATGSNYNVDLTMYYTSNELDPMIAIPADLRGWRQFPIGGIWYPTVSSASPIDNSVTVTGITDLTGAWTMAHPYFPIVMPLRALSADWQDAQSARIAWESELGITRLGYMVERSVRGAGEWSTVGLVERKDGSAYSFIDRVPSADSYEYRLIAFDDAGEAYQSESVILDPMRILSVDDGAALSGFALAQNTPNPFESSSGTIIRFSLADAGDTRLALYDSFGREVRVLAEGFRSAGLHMLQFDARGLESGTYFYRLISGAQSVTRKLVVTK